MRPNWAAWQGGLVCGESQPWQLSCARASRMAAAANAAMKVADYCGVTRSWATSPAAFTGTVAIRTPAKMAAVPSQRRPLTASLPGQPVSQPRQPGKLPGLPVNQPGHPARNLDWWILVSRFVRPGLVGPDHGRHLHHAPHVALALMPSGSAGQEVSSVKAISPFLTCQSAPRLSSSKARQLPTRGAHLECSY